MRGTNYDPTTKSSGPDGGKIPPGGVDRKGDREDAFRQKSADFYAKRLNGLLQGVERLSNEKAEVIRDEILVAARGSLRDWRKTPQIPGRDPDHGTRAWKIRIANDARPSRSVAGQFGISHVSVLRYRGQYAGILE